MLTLAFVGFALFAGILPGPSNPLLSLLPALVGTAAFVGVLALPPIADRLADRSSHGKLKVILTETARSIRDTKALLFRPDWRIIGAIAYLWCDIAVLVACFAAVGQVPPLATIVLAYQVGYLSNLIPIPGNIGVLDASLVGMLVLYGVNATAATAATVVYHGIALWIPAMWGTLAFLVLQRTRGEPITLRPSREERRLMQAERKVES